MDLRWKLKWDFSGLFFFTFSLQLLQKSYLFLWYILCVCVYVFENALNSTRELKPIKYWNKQENPFSIGPFIWMDLRFDWIVDFTIYPIIWQSPSSIIIFRRKYPLCEWAFLCKHTNYIEWNITISIVMKAAQRSLAHTHKNCLTYCN